LQLDLEFLHRLAGDCIDDSTAKERIFCRA